jgi:hypothetical protein
VDCPAPFNHTGPAVESNIGVLLFSKFNQPQCRFSEKAPSTEDMGKQVLTAQELDLPLAAVSVLLREEEKQLKRRPL